jgi:hypothetical protein
MNQPDATTYTIHLCLYPSGKFDSIVVDTHPPS